MKKLALVLALSLSGCSGGGGGGGSNGGFDDNGGSGTGTLKLTMTVTASKVPGDVVDDYVANLSISDPQNSAVAGATVTLHTPDGDLVMTETTPGLGFYSLPAGTHLYPDQGFRLDVDHAAGSVTGVSIAAPTVTDVTEPTTQDTWALATDAPITWNGRGAAQHKIEVQIASSTTYDSGWVVGDTGSTVIPAASMTTSGIATLTVRRRKEMTIPTTTARPGSIWRIDFDDDIAPIDVN